MCMYIYINSCSVCVFPVWVLRSSMMAACVVPSGLLSAVLCVGRSCDALWSAFRSCFMRHPYLVLCLSFAASAAVLSHIFYVFYRIHIHLGRGLPAVCVYNIYIYICVCVCINAYILYLYRSIYIYIYR